MMNLSPELVGKIQKDHQKKSNQVRKLQRKLKNKAKHTISSNDLLNQLHQRIKSLEKEPIDAYDPIYFKELKQKKDGQISELWHTIWMIEDMTKDRR